MGRGATTITFDPWGPQSGDTTERLTDTHRKKIFKKKQKYRKKPQSS